MSNVLYKIIVDQNKCPQCHNTQCLISMALGDNEAVSCSVCNSGFIVQHNTRTVIRSKDASC